MFFFSSQIVSAHGLALGPSKPLRQCNVFSCRQALDDRPSRGKSAVNRHLCSLMSMKIFRFGCQGPGRPSPREAEMQEAAASAVFGS